MSSFVRSTRVNRVFYAQNINMSYSFASLEKIASKLLGASVALGDILVCDNAKGTKRKALQKTATGWVIYYAAFEAKDNKFVSLAAKDGALKSLDKPIF